MIKKIRHIGIVVENLDGALSRYTDAFGLECSEVMEVGEIGVRIGFMPVGETLIEFLQYVKEDTGADSLVRAQKGPINHICFEVENIESALEKLKAKGLRVAGGFPRRGAHGKVAFFLPEDTEGALIEVCEPD